ncbi:MAG: TolC family protein [Elusimicrobia bacterium]|nr:TolC family protein [Elusimicrobiota bacterium]
MNRNRSLVSKEPELAGEINSLRKNLFEKEKQLFLKLEELVSIRTAIKDFYAKVYLPRLGGCMMELEEIKSRVIGLPPDARGPEDVLKPVKDGGKELSAEVKKEIKNLYRRLARLYHPDRPHDKEEQEFLTGRMAAINEAFRASDLESLKRYLKRADAEIGLNLSSPERIKCLEMELHIVESLDRLYGAKVEDLKKNELYKLMKKDPARQAEVFKGLEERFKFDIGIYKKILKRLSDRMMKKTLLPLLFVFFSVLPLTAQENPLELSWADCVRQALANNPGLNARKLAIEQNKYLYLAGYNSYLPRISISHSLARSGGVSSIASNSVGFSLSASEPLFDLGAMSSIRTSKLNYDRTFYDYRIESASLRQSLYSAFISLIVAQEQIKVNKKILDLREQNARLIGLKYESGMESRGNMMYAFALYELSKSDLQKSERSLETARRTLLKNMGLSYYPPVAARGELTVPEYRLKAEDLNLENIPQVASQKANIEIYKEKLFSIKTDRYPSLSASQSLSWSGVSEFPGDRSWSMGLSLSLPLFAGGITYYPNSVNAARLALKSAQESLRSLKISLENDIMSAYGDFLNSRDTAIANVNMLNANEERYKESQIKYMAGQIRFLDLANIEQSMVDAQQNHLRYLRDANTRKSALENLLGLGLEE